MGGFPCNQFLRQEPGANASEIFAVIKHVRPGEGFIPNFEMFAKSDVNGENQNPIYEFLKSRCPSVRKEFQAPYKLYYSHTTRMISGGTLKSFLWTTLVNL